MLQPEVTEFIVIAPGPVRDALVATGERFSAWMESEFPGKHFRVVTPALPDLELEAAFVLPIMNVPIDGSPDRSQICERPDPDLLRAISARLASFDVKGRALN